MKIVDVKEIISIAEKFLPDYRGNTMERIKKLSEDSGESEETLKALIFYIYQRTTQSEERLKQLEKSHKEEIIKYQTNELLLNVSKEELEILKSNADKAYLNYKKLTDALRLSKQKALLEVKEIDTKLLAAGVSISTESKSILGTLIAISFSIIFAIILIYFSYKISGISPTSNIEINYDFGKMVEAFLLGSGALIAGVAYAFSIFKRKVE